MISDAIDKIIELNRPETLTLEDGREYIKRGGYEPVYDPQADNLSIHTLTGIRDYITQNIDRHGSNEHLIIHVETYQYVNLTTALFGDFRQRETYLRASTTGYAEINGIWKPTEDFIIMLQSEFVKTDESKRLAQLTAGITEAASHEIKDDGISQHTTVKSGISMVSQVKIENPFTLKPYRTFPEIDQPDIDFVFRIKKSDRGPQCALFESDGGRWKIETIQKIKTWFEKELQGENKVKIIA